MKTYWAIQAELPSGFEWAVENYWDGECDLKLFRCQAQAERYARKLENKTGFRTRVREIKYER